MHGRRTAAVVLLVLASVAAFVGAVVLARTSTAAPAQTAGTTVRGSVNNSGGAESPHGGGSSQISGDGRYQIFVSDSDLAPGPGTFCTCDNANSIGVYVRDLQAGTTNLVSFGRNSDTGDIEAERNGSTFPSISDNGRYVSFITRASNIVTPPASGLPTRVVCDRGAPDAQGVFPQAPATGAYPAAFKCFAFGSLEGGFLTKYYPHLSGNAARLVWSDTNGNSANEVSVATLRFTGGVLQAPAAGDTQTLSFAGVPFPKSSGGDLFYAGQPAVSDDGNWVVAAVTNESTTSDNGIVEADLHAAQPVLARVDRADATNFVGNSGVAPGHPVVSGDGRVVAFDTDRDEANDAANYPDVYTTTVDTAAFGTAAFSPATPSVVVSAVANGTATGADGDGAFPAISADGRYLAFVTDRSEMYANSQPATSTFSCFNPTDTGGGPTTLRTPCQIVARDLVTDGGRRNTTQSLLPAQLASPSVTLTTCPAPNGPCAGNGDSAGPPSLSVDGAQVGYDSLASDLVPTDTNQVTDTQNGGVDAFVRTFTPHVVATPPSFGLVKLGRSEDGDVTITVHGFGPYREGATTVTGTDAQDFSNVRPTCDATPRSETDPPCTITIAFAPSAAGARSATLSLYPNGAGTSGSPTVTVALSGSGTASTPAKLAPGDTTRTSVTTTGGQASQGGGDSVISGNGRWDVFVSTNNLAARDASTYRKVFVRDLAAPQHTAQISLGGTPGTDLTKPGKPGGVQVDGDSYLPTISDDGRFVSFVTEATNIAPAATPDGGDIDYSLVVCDRDPTNKHDGAGNPILDLPQPKPRNNLPNYACYDVYSTDSFEFDALDVSYRPRLSGDGTHIAYTRDRNDEGTSVVALVRLAGVNGPLGTPGPEQLVSGTVPGFTNPTAPTISRDAGRVAFAAEAADGSGRTAIIEVDIAGGASLRLDVTSSGGGYLGDSASGGTTVSQPAMSGDGNEVAFSYGPYASRHVYVAIRNGNAVTSTVESLNNDKGADEGFQPALSEDGRYLAFVTDAFNMHDGVDGPAGACLDTGSANRTACQIVAKDLVRHTANELVSASVKPDCGPPATTTPAPPPPPVPNGSRCAGDQNSADPSLDADGSEVGFDSLADDLVGNDTNKTGQLPGGDAFVHTWRSTLTATSTDYGQVTIGKHKDRTVTATASGFGPVSGGPTSIIGANKTDYTVTATTCAGKVLHETDTCTLTIRFTPASAGPRTATISIATGRNGYPRLNPVLVQTLVGIGVKPTVNLTPGKLSATPDPVNFGTALPKAPGRSRPVTITDTGDLPTTLVTVTVVDTTVPGAHGDYTVHDGTCLGSAVASGASCTITVVFVGTAVGARPADLVLTDGNGNVVLIHLIAQVAAPTVLANPGVASPGHLSAISGTGFAPNRLVDISLAPFGETAQGTADSHGAFTATLVLYNNVGTGPGTVTAHSHGLGASISAETPLLLALGSVEGPILVTRH